MRWPSIDRIATLHSLPDGYRFEQLGRADIPALIQSIAEWRPDISISVGSCYLRESFYTEKVFLRDEAEKDVFVVLIMHQDEMAGMGSWEREPDALTFAISQHLPNKTRMRPDPAFDQTRREEASFPVRGPCGRPVNVSARVP